MSAAWRVRLRGAVQGHGVRPAIARWADEHGLDGLVRNTPEGVELLLAAGKLPSDRIVNELAARLSIPMADMVMESTDEPLAPGFVIEDSREGPQPAVMLPVDQAVCADCLREFHAADDRRFHHGLITCVHCGPRFSVLTGTPYDRPRTTLSGFDLCDLCRSEYRDVTSRRGHAQTISCPRCGPQVWAAQRDGRLIARHDDAVVAAATVLDRGGCLALRGVGGYQLLVDATSEPAVQRLRDWKRRPSKPLAVMCRTLTDAERLAEWTASGCEALLSAANPIVLTPQRPGHGLAVGVNPGVRDIGLLLPTTAVHDRLLELVGRPLVCTSGNREGQPLAVTVAEAETDLASGVELFLHHDRPIAHPVDDSVVRSLAGRVVTIRCARGLAPLSQPLSINRPLIALGGHQKSAIALANGEQAVLLPHLGDLDTVAMREQFDERLRTVASLYGVEHPAWVCDAHPDSYPRQWLRQRSELGLAVWHHHAHIAAATVEHGWRDREVLGVAWDGAGWGTDHTLWGGEFLLCHGPRWRRVAWLRPFALIGGDAAAREPLRSAVALLNQLPELTSHDLAGWLHQDRRTIERLQQAARSSQSVQTTSMGRLIDGIAALVLNVAAVDHEGAAALWWESLCDPRETGTYPWALHEGGVCELDWRPLLRAVLRDWRADVLPGIIAARFHRSLADLVRLVSASWPQQPVVLGGGVFQNRVLIEMLVRDWPATSPPLGLPGRIPPNDGGLAAGQLAVAASGIVS